ncbi:MAG: hypothetical protein QHH02_03655 [Syntrophomonadaceae bacterium]|nr:hypothetical protein [Syntrophomonadaceae bacterium]
MYEKKLLSARMRIVRYYLNGNYDRLLTARFKSDKGLEDFLRDRKDSIKVMEIKR